MLCSSMRAIYIINALYAHELYYDLFLAARSVPSQLCLHDTAYSGCSYMVEYIERVSAAGGEPPPPTCNYYDYFIVAI